MFLSKYYFMIVTCIVFSVLIHNAYGGENNIINDIIKINYKLNFYFIYKYMSS